MMMAATGHASAASLQAPSRLFRDCFRFCHCDVFLHFKDFGTDLNTCLIAYTEIFVYLHFHLILPPNFNPRHLFIINPLSAAKAINPAVLWVFSLSMILERCFSTVLTLI